MSLRLHNTAFEDEALYLYSGHMELEHLLHGTALQGSYAVVLLRRSRPLPGGGRLPQRPGRPDPGPDAQPGRDAADHRLALLHDPAPVQRADRLVRGPALLGVRVGDLPGQLRHLRRDLPVPAVFAAWIVVRTAGLRWPVFLLAAPVAALAVGVKYAGLLFVPTIAVLPALAGWPRARPPGAAVPAGVRRRGGGPALRRAAAGRQGVHDGHLQHHHAPRGGRDAGDAPS